MKAIDHEVAEVIRRIIREEFERIVPQLRSTPSYLTVRQCATRYRLGYSTVRDKVANGELAVVQRPWGASGMTLTLIVASDAEAKLGPGLVS